MQSGIDRYHVARGQNQASANGPELRYISKGMDRLVPAIDDIKRRVVQGESMPALSKWGIPILTIDSDKLSLITLSSIYNLSGHTNLSLYEDISERVLLQIVYETTKHNAKGFVQWIDTHLSDGIQRHVLHRLRAKAKDYTAVRWPKPTKLAVGSVLALTALEVCDELETCKVYTSNRQVANGIRVTPSVVEAIEESHEELALLAPTFLPMVVPPNDWTDLYNGGYLFGNDKFSCITPLVKESRLRDDLSEDIERLGVHPTAVNWLQQTRWKSNKTIQDLCRDIDINDAAVGGLLGTLPQELPESGHVNWDDEDQKAEWCGEARLIHEHNRKTMGKRTLFYQLQHTSKRMDKYPHFYFSWQMGFRGRFYPRFCGMDPQGDKVNKAYLKFAEPQSLGRDGFEAMTVNLANSMGFDKLPIPERIQSVHDSVDKLEAWVRDPLRNTGWVEEDGPMILAQGEEWLRANNSDNPEEFLSHMPCAIDGKCNGLQHLSAMARDPEGARAVCLEPMDTPQDIYMLVKHKVDEYIDDTIRQANLDQISFELPEKILPGDQVLLSVEDRVMRKRSQDAYACLNWRGKTSRKLVKRGAMTWAYGVTKQGIMDQLIADGFLADIEGNTKVNASYMRDAIYWGVNNVVTAARDVMLWLQEVAKIANSLEQPVIWTNPAGMVVTQEYLQPHRRYMETVVGRFSFTTPNKERKILHRKQVNGIAPNFVHSIDAAHMANVVLRLKEEGVRDMQMVHDSFGVHARHVPMLHRIVREEFVKIHERNLLQEFKDEVEERLGVELPPYPVQGDFDVQRVLDSRYAFT